MKKIAGLMVAVLAASVSAGQLYIGDVRDSRTYAPMLVDEMLVDARVEGLFVRTTMELALKDTVFPEMAYYGYETGDTLEANLQFELPAGSVIDSMSLWINGSPSAGFLKIRSKAETVYEGVVQRRRDPAILTKIYGGGDSYDLKIFPYVKKECRRVRISYTTPVGESAGASTIALPLGISGLSGSYYSYNYYDWSTIPYGIARHVKASVRSVGSAFIPVGDSQGGWTTRTSGDTSIVSMDRENCGYSSNLSLISDRSSSDAVTLAGSAGGAQDGTFMARVDLSKIFNTNDSTDLLVLVNYVSEYQTWNQLTQQYEQRVAHMPDSYRVRDLAEIRSFIKSRVSSGAEIRLLANADSLVDVNGAWFRGADTGNAAAFDRPQNNTPQFTPEGFYLRGLQELAGHEGARVLIIDRCWQSTGSTVDTVLKRQVLDSLGKLLGNSKPAMLVASTTYSGLLGAVYNWFLQKSPNAVYPAGVGSEMAGSLATVWRNLVGMTISPCDISFRTRGGGYVYDVTGVDGRKTVDTVLTCIGRVRNGDRIVASVNGSYNGRDYSYQNIFTLGVSGDDRIGDFWAAAKCSELAAAGDVAEATSIALDYRILSEYTALLAIDTGLMDSAEYRDDTRADVMPGYGWYFEFIDDGDGSIGVGADAQKSAAVAPALSVAPLGHTVRISFSGLAKLPSGITPKLCIYDLRGRLVAELSDRIDLTTGSVEWKAEGLSSGMYIVKLVAGSINLTKQFSIVQ